jgi:hypothetical protein
MHETLLPTIIVEKHFKLIFGNAPVMGITAATSHEDFP